MTRFTSDDEQYRDLDWVARDSDGKVQRRTIVQGAAWTIPVIAAASAAPLAAASTGTPTLTFVNGPYRGTACGTLGDIVLAATTDGTTPAAGEVITVTLPSGLTWSDGTTAPRPFTAGSDGTVTLTGVRTTGTVGDLPLSATSASGVTATSTVTVTGGTPSYATYGSGGTWNPSPLANVPAGATPVGTEFWLLDGTVYDKTGATIATNVASVSSEYSNWGSQNGRYLAWTDTSGVAHNASAQTPSTTFTSGTASVPNGATPVGSQFWIKDGVLYNQDGTQIATNVATAESEFENWGSANAQYVSWTDTSGVAHYASRQTPSTTFGYSTPSVPSGSTPVGTQFWIKDGTLYNNDGTQIATNVATAESEFENWGSANGQYVSWVDTSGTVHQAYRQTPNTTFSYTTPSVPNGATPVGAFFYLVNDTLYDQNGTFVADNVQAAATDFENWGSGNARYVAYVTLPSC